MSTSYNLSNIRTLLIKGFNEEDLRRLCFDDPNFNPVHSKLARNNNREEIVDQLLEYAEQSFKMETLLTWAEGKNVDRFEFHGPYHIDTSMGRKEEFEETTISEVNDSSSTPHKAGSSRPLRVFLSHSSKDKRAVRRLYRRLKVEGIDPWIDEEKLLPGQDWKQEIQNAVLSSDIVIICVSSASVTKAGFIQEEIRFALNIADQQQGGTIFLIPLKLEKCQVPEHLSRWHWVNLAEDLGYDKLLHALQRRAEEIGTFVPVALAPKESPSKFSILRSWQSWLFIGGGLLLTAFILAWRGNMSPSTLSLTPIPTPMPSDAVLPVVASTPTTTPISILTSTSTPTVTPLLLASSPTNTPTNIATPTQTATSIPDTPTLTTSPPQLVTTSIPPSPLPPTTTSVPPVPVGQIILLKPSLLDGASFGPTEFEWEWSGPIGSDQGFEVRVWREGEPPAGIHDAVKDNLQGRIERIGENKYRFSTNIKEMIGPNGLQPRPTGDYLWTVLLVQISPEYKDLGIHAVPGQLHFAAEGGNNGGGGDGKGATIN